jgi:hypothetical protein
MASISVIHIDIDLVIQINLFLTLEANLVISKIMGFSPPPFFFFLSFFLSFPMSEFVNERWKAKDIETISRLWSSGL